MLERNIFIFLNIKLIYKKKKNIQQLCCIPTTYIFNDLTACEQHKNIVHCTTYINA